MKIEEFGKENEKIIVMLHGAYFVHTYGNQYSLAKDYHIIVPHIMGFGNETNRTFHTDACIEELAEFIKSLNKKVMIVGFSLGAQLAFKLISEHEELFSCAIIVSPWLIKEEPFISKIMKLNLKQNSLLKNKLICNFTAVMNGLIPAKIRKEFVEQCQKVTEETVRNMVYNGITLNSIPAFADVSIPIAALAGEKEEPAIHDSVRKMAKINKNCRYEIWSKAAHNIPPMFAKKFNRLIVQCCSEK